MAPFAQSFLTAAGFDLSVWNASVGSQVPPPPPSSAPLAERVEWLFGRSIGGEEKRLFGASLYLNPDYLPRRARDKRRENSNKRCVFIYKSGFSAGSDYSENSDGFTYTDDLVRKTGRLCPLLCRGTKLLLILPRQARDKRRENSKTTRCFCTAYSWDEGAPG